MSLRGIERATSPPAHMGLARKRCVIVPLDYWDLLTSISPIFCNSLACSLQSQYQSPRPNLWVSHWTDVRPTWCLGDETTYVLAMEICEHNPWAIPERYNLKRRDGC